MLDFGKLPPRLRDFIHEVFESIRVHECFAFHPLEREEREKSKWEERIDPDTNPLTSFGRGDDFTEELIKGICEKKVTVSLATKGSTCYSNLQKEYEKPDGIPTVRKKQDAKQKGIR